jgi:GNAT superfamily N-acetyltransferase
MHVERCDSPAEFLLETASYRGAQPFTTNLLGSIANSIAEGSRSYEDCWWWLVRGAAGEVTGAAARTAPFGLVLGPMPESAVADLAGAVSRSDDSVPWVNGPREGAAAFARVYAERVDAGARRPVREGRRDLIYVIDELRVPEVAGGCREAGAGDYELARRWTTEFELELGNGPGMPEDVVRSTLALGRFRIWWVDDVPVSLAGHAAPVRTPSGVVTRVGPVYTPPQRRGRGFAAAVTAALTRQLMDGGARVMLYTDADNPVSNGVYQRLGFRAIERVARYDFTP